MLHRLCVRLQPRYLTNSVGGKPAASSVLSRTVSLAACSRRGAMAMPSLRRFFTTTPDNREIKGPDFWNGLTTEEKRQYYRCKSQYEPLDDVILWPLDQKIKRLKVKDPALLEKVKPVNDVFNRKVSLWQGDITRLEIDCIVNAANSSLLGGGGVDGAIHKAAGKSLFNECETLNGCSTGDVKVSSGHRLPAKRILHTVGPMGRNPVKLASCYERSLEELLKLEMRTIAFPCISTGVYGYPSEAAAHVALGTVRQFLETADNASKVDRIIFCVFLTSDHRLYHELLPVYFPCDPTPAAESDEGTAAKRLKTPPAAEEETEEDESTTAFELDSVDHLDSLESSPSHNESGRQALGSQNTTATSAAAAADATVDLGCQSSGTDALTAKIDTMLGEQSSSTVSTPEPSNSGDDSEESPAATGTVVPTLKKAFTEPARRAGW
eukprot:scpid69605/ scgid20618/ O-acetyl-ADP-ribose deacetylase MACROD1; MACRO domain-containing protein 1; Protein LRP16